MPDIVENAPHSLHNLLKRGNKVSRRRGVLLFDQFEWQHAICMRVYSEWCFGRCRGRGRLIHLHIGMRQQGRSANSAAGAAPRVARRPRSARPDVHRIARGVHLRLSLSPFRGRREDRVLAAPAVSRAICANKNAHEHTGSAETLRPSLRNGFTAYSALSPVNGLSCHRRPQEACFSRA